MGRFEYRKLKPEKQREFLDRLATIMTTFRNKGEARFFLQRLLTPSEIVMLMRRLQTAELLVHGRTYKQIQRKLKVGMSTIRSVDQWLTDAAYEYQLIREHHRKAAEAEKHKKQKAAKRHLPSTIPGTLSNAIRHDSRFILFRLLLGDF